MKLYTTTESFLLKEGISDKKWFKNIKQIFKERKKEDDDILEKIISDINEDNTNFVSKNNNKFIFTTNDLEIIIYLWSDEENKISIDNVFLTVSLSLINKILTKVNEIVEIQNKSKKNIIRNKIK